MCQRSIKITQYFINTNNRASNKENVFMYVVDEIAMLLDVETMCLSGLL